jgi:hypothetical protein
VPTCGKVIRNEALLEGLITMSPVTKADALFAGTLQSPDAPNSPPQMAPPKETHMTGSIPTTWNDERDAAFFKIAETLAADGLADDTATLATTVFAGDDLAAEIDKVLEDLLVAESWELMARQSVARSKPQHRNLVPVPVPARRRPA